jgi:hypothetical protein
MHPPSACRMCMSQNTNRICTRWDRGANTAGAQEPSSHCRGSWWHPCGRVQDYSAAVWVNGTVSLRDATLRLFNPYPEILKPFQHTRKRFRGSSFRPSPSSTPTCDFGNHSFVPALCMSFVTTSINLMSLARLLHLFCVCGVWTRCNRTIRFE